ncbi:DNA polymerase IV [bacterium]|nr:DNA polymerase IV [bacterium]MBT4335564.1 DNA polymerase IV [bacterium]MBT4495571.1 DNA polymerase IV [bacterium]MBT4764229.1 DNA polymerase IV [bacterium]MBT5401601.1 DNA polymerase IV [bacterium]
MNSYFATVEQQANPFIRGKPVGVCAYLSNNGCIVASSIEAKKVGIKTGCLVKKAKQLYPNIILLENDPNKYRTVTKKFFNIMTSYSEDFEPYSIDEAFLDLTGVAHDYDEAFKLAQEMNIRIKQEIGSYLKCSIGISYTKFLAKFVSDVIGVDEIRSLKSKNELSQWFERYKLTDIWGINIKLEERLNAIGIYTINELKKSPIQNLIQALGKPGYFLWAKVNGLEIDYLRDQDQLLSKSIGHSYCVPNWTRDKKYLEKVLYKLTHRVGKRLRSRDQLAQGIYIYWTYVDYSIQGYGKRFKLKTSVTSTEVIFNKAVKVLRDTELKDKVRMLAVGVFNLVPRNNQLSLFITEDPRISRLVDNINNVYGDYAIHLGRMWKTEDIARDRIGFRKID